MRAWFFGVVVLFACMSGVAEARTIYTIAGGGAVLPPEVGDHPVPATAISLHESSSLSALPGGNLLILSGGDTLVLDAHGMVRAVEPSPEQDVLGVDRSGTEYAHTPGSDQLLLRRPGRDYEQFASLNQVVPYYPTDMLVHPDGGVLLASSHVVVRVLPDGSTVRFAGTGRSGHFRDGVPASKARLRYPTSLAWAADGALLIADRNDNRVRRVDPLSGTITTVAGNGQKGFGGGGGPATEAPLTGRRGLSLVDTVGLRSPSRTVVPASVASARRGSSAPLPAVAPGARSVLGRRC